MFMDDGGEFLGGRVPMNMISDFLLIQSKKSICHQSIQNLDILRSQNKIF